MISFQKIGLALAFSPRMRSLLAEAARFRRLWNAQLVLIHVGTPGAQEKNRVQELLAAEGLQEGTDVQVFWKQGKPSEQILATCRAENVDLLIAGALKKEKLVQYYLGTVARKILRKSHCSVLMLTNPSTTPQPFKNIVVNADDSMYVTNAVEAACSLGMKDHAQWLHVVREIKMYGLTMSAADHCSETEYENLRQNLLRDEIDDVERILQRIPHEGLKVNIKLVSGKSGFELSKFTVRKQADLLVVGAPPRRLSLFDRMFPHDLEYIFADLPCNLLIVHPPRGRKEVTLG